MIDADSAIRINWWRGWLTAKRILFSYSCWFWRTDGLNCSWLMARWLNKFMNEFIRPVMNTNDLQLTRSGAMQQSSSIKLEFAFQTKWNADKKVQLSSSSTRSRTRRYWRRRRRRRRSLIFKDSTQHWQSLLWRSLEGGWSSLYGKFGFLHIVWNSVDFWRILQWYVLDKAEVSLFERSPLDVYVS